MNVEEVRLYTFLLSLSFYYADQLIACSWLLSSSQFSRWGKMLNYFFKFTVCQLRQKYQSRDLGRLYIEDFICLSTDCEIAG